MNTKRKRKKGKDLFESHAKESISATYLLRVNVSQAVPHNLGNCKGSLGQKMMMALIHSSYSSVPCQHLTIPLA